MHSASENIKIDSEISKKDVSKKNNKIPLSNKSKLQKKKGNGKAGGVIYIGHIPHGFYEDEMKSYFSQFGKVLAATVARSKKTGRSRGFGFVEFKDEEVAKIAAETMNNYLMFNKILKCRYIPPEEKRGRINEKKVSAFDFPKQKNRRINEKQKIEAFKNLTQNTYLEKAEAKVEEFKRFFQERGIDFSFQLKTKNNGCNDIKKQSSIKSSSNTCSESESKDSDNEFGILEIDESENEISFKTPPQVKKVIKKSLSSPLTPIKQNADNREIQEGKEMKKSKVQKTQKRGKVEKKAKKIKKSLPKKFRHQKNSLESVKKSFVSDVLVLDKLKKVKAMGDNPPLRKKQKWVKEGSENKRKKGLKNQVHRIEISVGTHN